MEKAATQDFRGEPFSAGTRARSSRKTKDQVVLKGKEQEGKGNHSWWGERRRPVGVPITPHGISRTVPTPGQAAGWNGKEPLAVVPEINAALQVSALREDRLEEMDPRICRNLGNHPQVAALTGFQTSQAYILRG